MKKISTIVITSREPFNTEGNSHMHYVDELKKSHRILFVDPPKSWPCKSFRVQQKEPNVLLVPYLNVFPMFFLPRFFGRLNDWFTALRLRLLLKDTAFILWQFDPYYLSCLGLLRPSRKIYFPLDGYSRDGRDELLARKSDLLVTVNSTFINAYYKDYSSNILLLPHGFSQHQLVVESDLVEKLKTQFGEFVLFTGTLTQTVDFEKLIKVADAVAPFKLVVLGKRYANGSRIDQFLAMENVYFLGHVSYKLLSNYVAASKLCLVSYIKETGTWRNPIKITDYLAQSKPVVNTIPLNDFAELEGKAIFTSTNTEKYVSLVKSLIREELTVDKKLVENYISQCTYDKLVSQIFEKLKAN